MRVLLVALVFAFASDGAIAADVWFPFKDPDSAFSVDVPGTPTVSTDDTTKAPDGTVIPIITYEVSGAPDIAIVVSDFTKGQYDAGKVIDGCVSAIKAEGVTQVLDRLSVLDGQVGHEVAVVDKDGNNIDDRVYFVGGHLYQVMAMVAKDATADQTAQGQRFLASFHFTAK
ncbi:MAG: hypothetical protein ABSA49_12920 [Rhizomicrobium sp.]|jgi:hypothetical protein